MLFRSQASVGVPTDLGDTCLFEPVIAIWGKSICSGDIYLLYSFCSVINGPGPSKTRELKDGIEMSGAVICIRFKTAVYGR